MWFAGVIAIVALFLPWGESQVSLNRTMPSGMLSVCPNEMAVFTCRVTGSVIIVWTSAEYITGSQLGFTTSNTEGTTRIVNNDVVAELTQNSDGILESELRIRASINSSIRCFPDDADSGVTVNLTVYNAMIPGRPTDAAAVEIASSIDSCTILVDWDPPTNTPREDISHYIVRDSINGDREEIITSTTSTLVTFQLRQCPNSLLISITAVDRCGREGPSASGIEPNFLPTSATMNNTTTTPSNAANGSPAATASIVVVVVVLLIVASIVTAVVIIVFRLRRKIQRSTGDELHELLQFNDGNRPKYDEDDFERIRHYKQPKVSTRAQEQNVETFMSEVVILLHTVKEEEMVAVYDHLKPPLDLEYTVLYRTSTGIEVTLGMFGDHKAALIRTSKSGDCQNEIERVLKSLPQVQLIVAVGFAYGKRDRCKLGDVLVSTTIDGIRIDESGRIMMDMVCHTEISVQAILTFTKTKWIDFVCTRDEERESELHCGVVVSSPMLLSDQSTLKKLFARQEKFIGGEMEGQELAQLTHLKDGEHHNIDFIIIKGVADFGDGTKEKDWQFTASLAAAFFAETRLKETHNKVYFLQHASAAETRMEQTESQIDHAAVPLGHILTKFELQVLSGLLDAYSNEKIKEIQKSIRKKQGGDISLEDVERSLRERGLPGVADELEQSLLKGVEKAEHYKVYKAALEGAKTVTLRYLRFLLIGVPRSGKSTMRRRMLQEIVNLHSLGQPSVSTGVAETHSVLVQKLTSKSATISGSKWASLNKGSSDASQADSNDEGDLHYLTHLFYSLISKPTADAATDVSRVEQNNTTTEATANVADTGRQQESTDTTVESVADDSDQKDVGTSFINIHSSEDLHRQQETSTDTTVESVADDSNDSDRSPEDLHRQLETTDTTDESVADGSGDSDQREVDAAFKKLTNILRSDSPEDLHELLEALTLINLMDIGGQPEFLDMLPAVTIGAALYLLFFRLDQDLHKHYPVTYLAPGETSEKTLETSYCIEEVIHQALASIACFSGQLPEEKAGSASSRAILIGTYKDKVKASDIACKEKEVSEKFGMYKYLLLKALQEKPFFAVDNMKGTDESEMSEIRGNIEKIIKAFFPKVPIPASWLMFRVVLQLLDKPVVTLAQCEDIARRLLMPTRVQEALWFFHHNIGSLLYYPDITSVKDLVMCTPQVIFDSVTTMITDKFKHGNYYLSSAVKKQFQQMGLFSLTDISKKTEEHRSTHLSPNQLVDVLKHNGILAEVKCDDEEATSSEPVEPKFIIPAVLKQASEEELQPSTSLEASPLMIRFEGGFLPFGVFSASIARLIARANLLRPAWRLQSKAVKKNKVKFLVAKAFVATLISRPQYLEIQIENNPGVKSKHTLAHICSTVRQIVVEALEATISKMKYRPLDSIVAATILSSQRPFHLAFTCCLHGPKPHSDHLMKVDKERYGDCLHDDGVPTSNLKREHLLWFEKDTMTEAINSDDHPRYSEDDFKRIRYYKQPTRAQEQDVKMFLSEVVILLHTVKEEEMVAVYDYLKPPMDLGSTMLYQTNAGIKVTLGMFGNHKAAVIRTSKGGDCREEIERALTSLPQVQLIIAMGFAYGKTDKCRLGDVLVSTAVEGVNNIRIDKSGRIKIDGGSVRHTAMSIKARNTFMRRNWIDFICTSDGDRNSEIHCGVVISAPILINNQDALQKLLACDERYIGGEMEGQELAQVTHFKYGEDHNIDLIVIKGVADFADGTKEKDWQFTASLAAATYAERRLQDTRNKVYCLQHAAEYNIEVTDVHLSRMEWIEDGQVKVVSIYDESAFRWRQIGQTLGLRMGVLESIDQDGHNVRDRVTMVLRRWYENASSLPHAHQYPRTWRGLINLLNDSELGELANTVHKALLQQKQPSRAPPLSTRTLGRIADAIYAWEGRIADELGLDQSDVNAIKAKYPMELRLQTRAALTIWKQRLGDIATYNNLITVFERAGYTEYADVVRNLTTGAYLTIDDLAEVYEAVLDANAYWYNIGLALDIPPGVLDGIYKKHHGNDAECLIDVLKVFLQQVYPSPSWKRLADAMASPVVNRGDIAKELRKKYHYYPYII